MDTTLTRILAADNPWLTGAPLEPWVGSHLPDPFIPRTLQLHADERVVLVVGPRQVGKSTLIWKTLAERGGPFLYLNCEEPSIRDWLKSPAAVLADLRDWLEHPVPLFFEEVQRLSEAGLFLKGLVDRRPDVPLYATGSSSFDLEARTRESLAGRANRHLLLPFSFDELSRAWTGSKLVKEQQAKTTLERMLRYGTYPRVHRAQAPERELAGLVEAFIIRDASDRFRIQHSSAFRKLLELTASQVGNLCNYSEWASLMGVSNDTVAEYVHLLQKTHVLRLVRPYVGGKRAELTSTPKVYFIDNGIRNLLFGGFQPVDARPDVGALWESFVFTELYKQINPILDTIRFWRSKSGAEVDFVVEHQGRILGCEVKAGDARGRLTRSARSFIEAYAPPLFLVVNSQPHPEQREGQTRVRFVRPTELAAAMAEFLEGAPMTSGAQP